MIGINNPKVSILIPCYNSSKLIAETLRSSLEQTWQNKEIIVVDDGSTDDSLAIAKQFESATLKVINQENKGASAARNRALIQSQGDFIQYLDADDLLAPDKIELQINLLQRSDSNSIIAGEWGRFYKSPLETSFITEKVWQDMSSVDWLVCSWGGGGMMPLHSWLVPHNIADRAGVWNEELSVNDDGEYFCRVVLASQGVKFCMGAKSYYRSGIPNSLSTRNSDVALESAFLAIKLCSSYLLASEDNVPTRHVSATAFQRFIYSAYPNVLDLVKQAEMNVRSLGVGGSDLQISGSLIFQIFKNILGWKTTKRIQQMCILTANK